MDRRALPALFFRAQLQVTGVALAWASLEWIYYDGGTSTFLDSFPGFIRLGAALLASGGLLAALLVLQLPFAGASAIWPKRARELLAVVPAVALATLVTLLADHWLTASEAGAATWRAWAWRAVPVGVAVAGFFRFRSTLGEPVPRPLRLAAPLLLGLCALWVAGRYVAVRPDASLTEGLKPARRPHVILLGGDGIEARRTTLYRPPALPLPEGDGTVAASAKGGGLPVDSTPYLRRLGEESVLYENAFSNAGKTTGSTASMLNGIHPLDSKVMFPPQVFSGPPSYRHLPRMFEEWGYRTYQSTIRYYADAEDLNMVGGFQTANGRRPPQLPTWAPARALALAINDELYFLRRRRGEVGETLSLFFGKKPEVSAFRKVMGNVGLNYQTDRAVLEDALALLEVSSSPVFMHLHLLQTHCCTFRASREHFTADDVKGMESTPRKARDLARHLSTLKDFDDNVAFFVEALRERGLLDTTLLVVSSDHGVGWLMRQRVPLLIRVPHKELVGRVAQNVELLSVPATLLHLLGVDASRLPDWMHATRLPLPGDPPAEEAPLILGIDEVIRERYDTTAFADTTRDGLGHTQLKEPGPPAYGVGVLAVVKCDQVSRWIVKKQQWKVGRIPGHSRPCEADPALSEEERRRVLHRVELRYGVDLTRD